MTDAERAAYESWLAVWERMTQLKKAHSPNPAPLKLWMELERELNSALLNYKIARRTARAA